MSRFQSDAAGSSMRTPGAKKRTLGFAFAFLTRAASESSSMSCATNGPRET